MASCSRRMDEEVDEESDGEVDEEVDDNINELVADEDNVLVADEDMYDVEGIDVSWIKSGRLHGRKVLLNAEIVISTFLLYRYDIYSRPLWRTILSDSGDFMTIDDFNELYKSKQRENRSTIPVMSGGVLAAIVVRFGDVYVSNVSDRTNEILRSTKKGTIDIAQLDKVCQSLDFEFIDAFIRKNEQMIFDTKLLKEFLEEQEIKLHIFEYQMTRSSDILRRIGMHSYAADEVMYNTLNALGCNGISIKFLDLIRPLALKSAGISTKGSLCTVGMIFDYCCNKIKIEKTREQSIIDVCSPSANSMIEAVLRPNSGQQEKDMPPSSPRSLDKTKATKTKRRHILSIVSKLPNRSDGTFTPQVLVRLMLEEYGDVVTDRFMKVLLKVCADSSAAITAEFISVKPRKLHLQQFCFPSGFNVRIRFSLDIPLGGFKINNKLLPSDTTSSLYDLVMRLVFSRARAAKCSDSNLKVPTDLLLYKDIHCSSLVANRPIANSSRNYLIDEVENDMKIYVSSKLLTKLFAQDLNDKLNSLGDNSDNDTDSDGSVEQVVKYEEVKEISMDKVAVTLDKIRRDSLIEVYSRQMRGQDDSENFHPYLGNRKASIVQPKKLFPGILAEAYDWNITLTLKYICQELELAQYEDVFRKLGLNGHELLCLTKYSLSQYIEQAQCSKSPFDTPGELHIASVVYHATIIREDHVCARANLSRPSLLHNYKYYHLGAILFTQGFKKIALLIFMDKLDGINFAKSCCNIVEVPASPRSPRAPAISPRDRMNTQVTKQVLTNISLLKITNLFTELAYKYRDAHAIGLQDERKEVQEAGTFMYNLLLITKY